MRTSMPSTCSPGMSNEAPRMEKSVVAAARSIEVPMAYLLFSMTKTTGRFQSLAMLKLS
ncbi:hypothetical protein D3C72_2387350 [compost metagenome]